MKWHTPVIYYNSDGEFGQQTGYLLKSPYLKRRWWIFGPREGAVTARIADFRTKYCETVTGLRSLFIRLFGTCLVKHETFELWRWNWTVYRLPHEATDGNA